jgi:Holliday junction DNA helicase RuvA
MAMGSVLDAGDDVIDTTDDIITSTPAAAPKSTTPSKGAAQADALSALLNLGYGHGDAAHAIAQAASENPDADMSALIKAGLKLLAPRQ